VTDLLGIEHPILSAGIPVIGVDLVAAVAEPARSVLQRGTVRRVRGGPCARAVDRLGPSRCRGQVCAGGRHSAHSHGDDGRGGCGAARAGVSVIVAQGHEAGGGLVGEVGGMVITPAVVEAVASVSASPPPVASAGGIVDGRGLAAALMLGAEGVVVGTRFLATHEAAVAPAWKAAICAALETETLYTKIGNLVARPTWAPVSAGRVLRTKAIAAWIGREAELAALPEPQRAELANRWAEARAEARMEETEFIAGQDCGLIRDVLPAADVVRRMVADAEALLRRAVAGV